MKKFFLSTLCVLSLVFGCTKSEPPVQPPVENQVTQENASVPVEPPSVSNSEDSFQKLIEKDFSEAMAKAKALEATNPEEASRAYQVLTEDYPNRFEPYHRLALLFENEGDDEAAIALYEEAMRKNPTDAAFFNDFGWYSYTQNELVNAEVLLRKANLLAPNTPKYMVNLAVVVAELGRWDDAF
ncbi:MAG: tetratricopeptide repeat protein, partial [Thermoguttaceae bacterium]